MSINILIKKHAFLFIIVLILIFSALLRFYKYNNRWGIAYDQAHDALVARYALKEKKIPLVGPFSSAGPFQTGGEWYWLIMAGTVFYPQSVLTPWIVLTSSSLVFVLLMILLGREIKDNLFALISGLLAAVSTAQISQSFNLTNQSPLPLLSLSAIWVAVRFIRNKKSKYLFLLGFIISLAVTIHLQGAGLLVLILTTLLLSGFPDKKGIVYLMSGIFLPFIPLLVFDIQNDFVNIKGVIHYLVYTQDKISYEVLGRRWLTYVFEFWPNAWANITGGKNLIVYSFLPVLLLMLIYSFLKKKLTKEESLIGLSLVGMVFLLRYVKTPLFDSYLMFTHPLILFLTAWFIHKIIKTRFVIGLVFLTLIFFGSLDKDISNIRSATNSTASMAGLWKEVLVKKFPDKKFAVYDYQYKQAGNSLPLSLFLEADGKINDNGLKIGIAAIKKKKKITQPVVYGKSGGYQFFNLTGLTTEELSLKGWIFVNPSAIYFTTEEWYKN